MAKCEQRSGVSSMQRRIDELQCQMIAEDIERAATVDLPQCVRQYVSVADSSVVFCYAAASLRHQEELIEHQNTLAEYLAAQRARQEVVFDDGGPGIG